MKYLYCLLYLIFFAQVSAQTEITGKVYADDGKPLYRASIILYNQKDEIETYGFSDTSGSFSLITKTPGSKKLHVNVLNSHPKEIALEADRLKQNINLGNITVERLKETEIKEVTITRANPIKLKKDTVEYTAAHFSNGSEKNVEELLKKLPGVTVESDGKIKFKNKEVSKVLVEGDDLFERGYQTLTQNMPTSPVEKIQVLTGFSKNRLLKSIENSDQVAINLSLKEDAKNRWFGSLMLASTSYKESMRQGKINLMNFSKRRKIYLLANANNLGVNEMSGVQYLMNPASGNSSEEIETGAGLLSVVNLHQKNGRFEDKRTNFNNDFLTSLNYINNFRNGWKLKFVTIFNTTENRNDTDSYYHFDYSGTNFTNIESKTWKQKNTNIIGKIELSREFRNNASVEFYSKTSSLNEDNRNSFIFNGTENPQKGNNRLFSTENRLTYTRKIDSSQAFVAVGKFIFQHRPYHFKDYNNVAALISGDEDATGLQQNINSEMLMGAAKLTYLKKYGEENSLDIFLSDDYRHDRLNTDLRILNASGEAFLLNDPLYTNQMFLGVNRFQLQVRRQLKLKKWSFTGIALQQLITSAVTEDVESGYYFSPSLNVSYENRKTGTFSIFGGRRFSATVLNQMYSGYIYQGSRNFTSGTTGFQILPDYNFGFSYQLGDRMSEFAELNFFYSRNEKYIAGNIIVNPEYSYFQNILVKDSNMYTASSEIRKYIRFIKARISILNSFMKSDYRNSINSQPLIASVFSSFKTGFEMKTGWIRKINMEAGYEWNFNRIHSEVNRNRYLDQKGFFNFYYNYSRIFRAESYFEFYKFGNTSHTTQFWDVKLNYQPLNSKISLFVAGNNLLNSNSIQRYSVDNVSESLYTQRLLPRNIVLGFNKSF